MKEIKVGLIGFGTVGQGMVRLLRENADLLKARVGIPLCLKAIADLDVVTDRGIPLEGVKLTTEAKEVLTDPEIQIVVELIGGCEPARTYILEACQRKKHVVTANKAVLALHGQEIFETARKNGVRIAFEASVAGGIPIVRVLRDGLVADRLQAVFGIINGTCNYILTEMTEGNRSFQQALKSAQQMGYAEADPSFDLEGWDAAHKLLILIGLAYGKKLDLEEIHVEGISGILPLDIEFARELGYRVKLLAIAKQEDGRLEARVHPTLVPERSLLATVSGVFNAIYLKGEATGSTMLYGAGAGMMPTGCAVVADLVEIALNLHQGEIRSFAPFYSDLRLKEMADTISHYYLRFSAMDRPGVLSKVSGVLGENDISIASVIQKGRQVGGAVPVVMMTHEARESNVRAALVRIDQMPVVRGKTVMIRMEQNLD